MNVSAAAAEARDGAPNRARGDHPCVIGESAGARGEPSRKKTDRGEFMGKFSETDRSSESRYDIYVG